MKAKILIASLTAASLSTTVNAADGFTISGQVHVAAIDGGSLEDFAIVDNGTSGSRFRFKAKKKFGNGLTIGTRYELQAQFADSFDSAEIGQNAGSDAENPGNAVREVRYADIWLKGGFGKIAIGRGDGAANGTAESTDLLNVYAANESHELFNGVGTNFTDVDGLSRQNRIRYDSPNFGGFKFAVSLDEEDENEIAGFYNSNLGGGKLSASVGMTDGAGDQETFDFSVAYKFPFGLGLGYSTGERDNSAGITTSENDWFMISYDISKHFVISAGFGEEEERDGDTGLQVGGNGAENEFNIFSLVWKPVDGVDVYLNYADWENNIVSVDSDDDNAIALGARFRF